MLAATPAPDGLPKGNNPSSRSTSAAVAIAPLGHLRQLQALPIDGVKSAKLLLHWGWNARVMQQQKTEAIKRMHAIEDSHYAN